MTFFDWRWPPPLPPPFLDIFSKIYDQNIPFWNQKICNVIFCIGNDPPPPFGTFTKKHPYFGIETSLGLMQIQPSSAFFCMIFLPLLQNLCFGLQPHGANSFLNFPAMFAKVYTCIFMATWTPDLWNCCSSAHTSQISQNASPPRPPCNFAKVYTLACLNSRSSPPWISL